MRNLAFLRVLRRVSKIIRILVLITIYPLSFLFPRKKDLWVYGSYGNSFCDNSKYQFLWTAINNSEITAVWVTGSPEIVSFLRSQGFQAYLRWSFSGLWVCLRAKIYIFSSYLSDINFWTSGRALRVNLWHGVGLKNIEFAISEGPLKKYYRDVWWNPYRLLIPWIFCRPDLFLSTSPFMTIHFSKCFRVAPTRCFEGAYPRLTLSEDLLLNTCAKHFGEYDVIRRGLAEFERWIVYMPTWRDSSKKMGLNAALSNYDKLSRSLRKTNSVLVIKAHHNETFDHKNLPGNIFIWDRDTDIYPMLHEFDVLITDYSSVLYDFLALKKKDIILYIYDINDYLKYSRSLAFSFEENTTGIIAKSFDELCEIIENTPAPDDAQCSRVANKFWEHNERGCEAIHRAIFRLLARSSQNS